MSDKPSFGERLRHSWNAFINPVDNFRYDYGRASYINPTKIKMTTGNERSIITPVYNRIALDVAALDIKHVKLDDTNERFKEVIDDGLNKCLSLMPNKDQISNSFIQDVVLSLFDEGSVAIVPIDTTINPKTSEGYDINEMRVAQIIQWYPDHVQVRIYNDKTGNKEEKTFPKSMVAIVENPFYVVMNEPNSVAKRLIRKLNILDVIDEQSGSGKLDIIVQLPGIIKTEARKKAAEDRRKNIEDQLAGSKYGIAYIDGTEKVTQLNRSIENNLLNQITFLTSMLYSQLGITEEVLKGTANDQTMLNYYNNTVVPVITAIVKSMQCKFISKTARTRHHSIMYFRDPFKNTPVDKIAELTDKFTRNEVASSNEMRSVIGWKPVDDPRADELRNKNLNAESGVEPMYTDESSGGRNGPIIPEDIGKMKLSELKRYTQH
ncbi:MAG: phage portal protein [Pseudobutyrivibrio sp.]|nr:phage portal protein [Pseudobutyrivibrio sp.]